MYNRIRVSKRCIVIFVLGICIVALYLNISAFHYYMPLDLWARVTPIVLLLIGMIGSINKIKVLRLLGWLGVMILLLICTGTSFPPEEYRLGDPGDDPESLPRVVSSVTVIIKLATGLAMTCLIAWLYRRLGGAADELDRLRDLEDRFR